MTNIAWEQAGEFEDIRYEKAEGIAKITINRPEVRNAFRPLTVVEMMRALEDAREDLETGVIILTGEGPDAFCSGGDQKVRGDAGYLDSPTTRDARRGAPLSGGSTSRTCTSRSGAAPSPSSPWSPATRSAGGTCCT